jgi:hypothetical protein
MLRWLGLGPVRRERDAWWAFDGPLGPKSCVPLRNVTVIPHDAFANSSDRTMFRGLESKWLAYAYRQYDKD